VERLRLREVTSKARRNAASRKPRTRCRPRRVPRRGARARKKWLDDGYGITIADLDKTAKMQGVTVQRGDFVIVRTGQMEAKLEAGSWDGYPAATRPVSPSRRWVDQAHRLAAPPPTLGLRGAANESSRASTSPGTGSPSRSWA